MTNTIKIPVSAYESKNAWVRGETKVCPVTGYHVALVHDCDKAHK